ncbi:lactate dehydrogenase [Streptomyces zinciresistens K42]|uniref:Lactate dehydrogenase n=1 Tax=Streptomyces zinciresistens K42 TaxID=700597 RepID=G2GP30_9ACTN|nr:NAD(P)-binding domain-containing protein [Streptomyces zinciresistens]EGX54734.1 lactate dehydrogenase [Streptomyces zinciresistens K42]
MTPPPLEAVGVIGAGAVGQAVSTALVASAPPGRLLIASRVLDQAVALAADLGDMRHATASPVHPEACDVEGLADCTAVVVAVRTAFTNTHTADVRMAGAAANAPVIRALAACLHGYQGTVLVVTNPVDLMPRLFAEASGCPRVYGIGSNLDSARFRLTLARLLNVPADAVQGHVIGEHGDGAVVCASSTTVNGTPAQVPLAEVRAELRTRPGRISAGVGRTRSGPAGAVLSALRKALGLVDGTEELTAEHRGDWLGIPLRFTSGRPVACLPALNADEDAQLAATLTKLRGAYGRSAVLPHPQPLWRRREYPYRHPAAGRGRERDRAQQHRLRH